MRITSKLRAKARDLVAFYGSGEAAARQLGLSSGTPLLRLRDGKTCYAKTETKQLIDMGWEEIQGKAPNPKRLLPPTPTRSETAYPRVDAGLKRQLEDLVRHYGTRSKARDAIRLGWGTLSGVLNGSQSTISSSTAHRIRVHHKSVFGNGTRPAVRPAPAPPAVGTFNEGCATVTLSAPTNAPAKPKGRLPLIVLVNAEGDVVFSGRARIALKEETTA